MSAGTAVCVCGGIGACGEGESKRSPPRRHIPSHTPSQQQHHKQKNKKKAIHQFAPLSAGPGAMYGGYTGGAGAYGGYGGYGGQQAAVAGGDYGRRVFWGVICLVVG